MRDFNSMIDKDRLGLYADPVKKTPEEEELELYTQFLESKASNPAEMQQKVDTARIERDKTEDTADWAQLAKDLGLLAGGALGGAMGGGLQGAVHGAGLMQPAIDMQLGEKAIARRQRDLEQAEKQQIEGLAASKGLRDVRREDVKDTREEQTFETQQKQADQGYQMGEMQINKLQRDVQDEEVMRDPNSDISKRYRAMAKAVGTDPVNASAYELQQQMPILQQMFQIDMQKQNMRMQEQAQAQQASQFNQTMDMNRQKQAYDAQMNQGVKERQLTKENVELVKNISEKVLDNDIIKTAKKDADQINTILNTLQSKDAKGNAQLDAKTVQVFEKLLAGSNDVEEATGRGISEIKNLIYKVRDFVAGKQVDPQVIFEMQSVMQSLLDQRLNSIDTEQSGTVEALQYYGFTPDDARQYIVDTNKYRRN